MRHALDEASLGSLIRVVETALGKPLTVIDATSNVIAAGRSPDTALLSDDEGRNSFHDMPVAGCWI